MSTKLETLRGYQLHATDGTIGRVRDLLVEEGSWTGRWLVVDTGKWLLGRKVVLSPVAFEEPDHENKEIRVSLTKEEIESAPSLDSEAPVSREFEKTYFDHYQWPYYWMGGGLWGGMSQPYSLNPTSTNGKADLEEPDSLEQRDTILRSGHELTKYRLKSNEEVMGYVEDLLIDTDDWSVHYFQCDTRKWWHGKTLQISPEKVKNADWPDHSLHMNVTQQELDGAAKEADEGDDAINAQVRALFGVTTVASGDSGSTD